LPVPGTRIRPSDAVHMPKLVEHYKATPILQTETSANHYRLVGLEIASTNTTLDYIHYNLVVFGVENAKTEDRLAHHMFIDRCYIHGTPTGDVGRGVAPNGNYMAIVDSNISDIHLLGFEIQAIAAWEGSGPFKIVNNYLEASGINVLFGGAKGTVPNLIPSDIEIRNNHFFKPLNGGQKTPVMQESRGP